MEKSRYSLKRKIFYYRTSEGIAKIVNEEITDAIAESFLSKNPERIQYFQEYPEDWTVRIGIEDEPTKYVSPPLKQELEGMKMGQLREAYPDAKYDRSKDAYIQNILISLGLE